MSGTTTPPSSELRRIYLDLVYQSRQHSLIDQFTRDHFAGQGRSARRKVHEKHTPEELRAFQESQEYRSFLEYLPKRDPLLGAIGQALQNCDQASCMADLPRFQDEYTLLEPALRDAYLEGRQPTLRTLREDLKQREAEMRKQAQIEQRRHARELLNQSGIVEELNGNLSEYVRDLMIAIRQYLSEEDLSRPLQPATDPLFGAATGYHPLSKGRLQLYFEQFPARSTKVQPMLMTFVCSMLDGLYAPSSVLSACLKRSPELQGARDELADAIIQWSWSLLDLLSPQMTRDRVFSMVAENPRYQKICRKMLKEANSKSSLHQSVLRAIPDRYRDLYPDARAMRRHFVLHIGPTNSGKTHDAIQALMAAPRGVYLAPLRLLAYEQYESINRAGVPCSLLTGEERKLVWGAGLQASTIEMADLTAHYDVAVIDEGQMIADRDRGGSWSAAMLGLCADEIHVCAAPQALQILKEIIHDCEDTFEVIEHKRQTPLTCETKPFYFPGSVTKGDALIVFSKRNVHAVASDLQKRGLRCSVIYGALPYDVRHEEARKFAEGETDFVVATDAIGMGLNLPIQRIVFLEDCKFDGQEVRALTTAEIKQIAGRAGRLGIYDEGFVNAPFSKRAIRKALTCQDPPIERAVIRFPETLLGIDAPLRDILRRWMAIEPHDGWDKASCERMLKLTELIERKGVDKDLIYTFICIPFDEEDMDLLTLWMDMAQSEIRGKHLPVERLLPDPPEVESCDIRMLDSLEQQYRVCDLIYNYARRFLAPESEDDTLLMAIEYVKEKISGGIMHILSTQRLTGQSFMRRQGSAKNRRGASAGQRRRGSPWSDDDDDFDDD
ncbi:MAG: hypothetical protein IJ083_15550 [Clostridia bacterium]|nr:hypothetical protein [Clostridia bacterium]